MEAPRPDGHRNHMVKKAALSSTQEGKERVATLENEILNIGELLHVIIRRC